MLVRTHIRRLAAGLAALCLALPALTGGGASAYAQRERGGQRAAREERRQAAAERKERKEAARTAQETPRKKRSGWMGWRVEEGDTVYFAELPPAWIFASGNRGKDKLRKYYKLIHNFNKVYPYAQVAKGMIRETDSVFATGTLSRRQREKYVNGLQKGLMRNFMGAARHMTISQGQLLMKLIDRETGHSSYDIIRNYKSGSAAGFWQGIARIFGTDMKRNYDPAGADRNVEELVKKWENGTFPSFYYSVFGELPPKTVIPDSYRRYMD